MLILVKVLIILVELFYVILVLLLKNFERKIGDFFRINVDGVFVVNVEIRDLLENIIMQRQRNVIKVNVVGLLLDFVEVITI